VGAILASGARGDPRLPWNQTPVYAVNPVSARAILLFGVDTAVDTNGSSVGGSSGDPLFTYDFFKRGLWTLGGAPGSSHNVRPGFQSIGGGPFEANCMADFADWDTGFGTQQPTGEVSTWVVAGDGITYVQMEDDQSVYRVDNRTCQVLGGFSHRKFSESHSENDQMACDPVTFGPGSPSAPASSGFSVLWIRDSGPNTVSAYQIPDGYCPFPTRLAYTGMATASPGQATAICFVLKSMSAGVQLPLANQPVRVTFAEADIGSGMTDATGTVCRPATAPISAGFFRATATFAGNNAYLPSTAEATLVVVLKNNPLLAGVALPPTNLGGLAASQSATGPQPNSAPGAEPVTGVTVQTQAQAQAQAQSQAQSVAQVQPGVMVQTQRRTQVAIQRQAGTDKDVAYQASGRRRIRQAPVVAVAMGMMALGLGLAVRPPRWALARLSRRGGRRR
jgi:hypothetical protein